MRESERERERERERGREEEVRVQYRELVVIRAVAERNKAHGRSKGARREYPTKGSLHR